MISGRDVKLTGSLGAPLTVTTTGPEVAAAGTVTLMEELDQVVTGAFDPLNATVLVPWLVPNPVPVIVTAWPVFPEFGVMAEMLTPETVKFMPLLVPPPTTTTTLPVVAPLGTGTTMLLSLQLEGVAAVPLNLTLLDP